MYYGAAGLGAVDPSKSSIRWWCWDIPGFKACHASRWNEARDYCAQIGHAGYTSMEVCINKETDAATKAECDCPDSPPAPGAQQEATLVTWVLGLGVVSLLGVVIWKQLEQREQHRRATAPTVLSPR